MKAHLFQDTEISEVEQTLIEQADQSIARFLETDETVLRFEPMNSYRRRLIHKLGTDHGLESHSVGEGPGRAVCLLRAGEALPDDWEELPIQQVQPAEDPDRERPPREARPPREPRPDIPRPAVIDRGSQTFYALPGAEIILRADGSFGVRRQDDLPDEIVHERVVPNGMFRVRQSRIICASDPEWRAL